jgi:hypothetical protein
LLTLPALTVFARAARAEGSDGAAVLSRIGVPRRKMFENLIAFG